MADLYPIYPGVPNYPQYTTDTTQQTSGWTSQLPNYTGLSDEFSNLLSSWGQGQLDPATVAQMKQAGAEYGVEIGSTNAPAANADFERAIGLSAEGQEQKALQDYVSLLSASPRTTTSTTTKQTDQSMAIADALAKWQQQQMNAVPNPAGTTGLGTPVANSGAVGRLPSGSGGSVPGQPGVPGYTWTGGGGYPTPTPSAGTGTDTGTTEEDYASEWGWDPSMGISAAAYMASLMAGSSTTTTSPGTGAISGTLPAPTPATGTTEEDYASEWGWTPSMGMSAADYMALLMGDTSTIGSVIDSPYTGNATGTDTSTIGSVIDSPYTDTSDLDIGG